jgi:lysophospholipase L1-like esterase
LRKVLRFFFGTILMLGLIGGLFQIGNIQSENEKISVFIAGDSTACNYEAARVPRTGWGQVLGQFFTEQVIVKNEAISGRSSLSFINEGALDKILNQIKPKDFLLIQFGHNDEKKNDPARYTEPFTTFKSYLAKYIQGARSKGAFPVLLTPINRYSFNKTTGKLVDTHGDYPKAMLELAAAEQVPVIDLTEQTRILLERLGPEKANLLFMNLKPGEYLNYPDGSQDNTHMRMEGAIEVAHLVIEGIRQAKLPLAQYIKPEFGK